MMLKIVVFSFFSGVGILDLAFENSGYDVVFVNDFEKKNIEAYRFSRKLFNIKEPLYGYSTISAAEYLESDNKLTLIRMIKKERGKGNIVGFIGGPPCPDFSIGGKNKGAEGKNGALTKTYFDLIIACQPDFFVFENVKGLIKTEKHKRFYYEMKARVSHNGYVISDKLVNALSYSVPQFRERIIMIGILGGLLQSSKNNLIDSNNRFKFPWERYEVYDLKMILNKNWPEPQAFIEGSRRKCKYDVPQELTIEYWFKLNNVERHPNQKDQFGVKRGMSKIQNIMEGDTKRKSFKRLHRWKYSPTAAYGNNEVHLHPYRVRRLSVAETMAIQSLPADFILPDNLSLTSKFKMIGNGVPYLMARNIAKTLYEVMEDIISSEGKAHGRKNELQTGEN